MKTELFLSVLNAIKNKEIVLSPIVLKDQSERVRYYDGSASEDFEFEYSGMTLNYEIIGGCSGVQTFAGSNEQPEEWHYSEPSLEVILISVTNEDGEDIKMASEQTAMIEKAIKDNTEIEK